MWYSTEKLQALDKAFKQRTHNLSDDEKKIAWEKEMEDGWQEIQDCVLAFKAGPNILSGGRFDTLSLGTWYEIIKAIDLTYIPIRLAGFANLVSGVKDPAIPLSLPNEATQYRGMVRLDPCGSAYLKEQFSYRGKREENPIHGARQDKDDQWFFDMDDRTIHGLLTYVGQIGKDGDIECPIWWRPWIKALQISVSRSAFMGKSADEDTWPMEWRAIVQNGELTAVSAYYIQAPFSLTKRVEAEISSVVKSMRTMLVYMKDAKIQPWHPRYIGALKEDDVSFVCDFISTEDGPVWLEAGPAVPVNALNIPVQKWGAHPCCFIDRPVKGALTSSGGNALDLSRF